MTEADLFWLGDRGSDDAAVVGGKGASLSRMIATGLPVPPGFVVGAGGFARFSASIRRDLARLLGEVDVTNDVDLSRTAREIGGLIRATAMPGDLAGTIGGAYTRLGGTVAVRSSAVAEDSWAASYAGQQETYLGVVGVDEVIARVLDCWASFFSERALFYRKQKGSLGDVGMAVVVQRMIVPEKAGVMFTVDPVQRRRDRLVVEAVWGHGDALVSGAVTPDNYQVARHDARVRRAFVPPRRDGDQPGDDRSADSSADVSGSRRRGRVLDDEEISRLVALGLRLEELFDGPQDVEWAISEGSVYLLQSRPITSVPGHPGRSAQ